MQDTSLDLRTFLWPLGFLAAAIALRWSAAALMYARIRKAIRWDLVSSLREYRIAYAPKWNRPPLGHFDGRGCMAHRLTEFTTRYTASAAGRAGRDCAELTVIPGECTLVLPEQGRYVFAAGDVICVRVRGLWFEGFRLVDITGKRSALFWFVPFGDVEAVQECLRNHGLKVAIAH